MTSVLYQVGAEGRSGAVLREINLRLDEISARLRELVPTARITKLRIEAYDWLDKNCPRVPIEGSKEAKKAIRKLSEWLGIPGIVVLYLYREGRGYCVPEKAHLPSDAVYLIAEVPYVKGVEEALEALSRVWRIPVHISEVQAYLGLARPPVERPARGTAESAGSGAEAGRREAASQPPERAVEVGEVKKAMEEVMEKIKSGEVDPGDVYTALYEVVHGRRRGVPSRLARLYQEAERRGVAEQLLAMLDDVDAFMAVFKAFHPEEYGRCYGLH